MPVFAPRRNSACVWISLIALVGALAPLAHAAEAQPNDASAVDPTGTITLASDLPAITGGRKYTWHLPLAAKTGWTKVTLGQGNSVP